MEGAVTLRGHIGGTQSHTQSRTHKSEGFRYKETFILADTEAGVQYKIIH